MPAMQQHLVGSSIPLQQDDFHEADYEKSMPEGMALKLALAIYDDPDAMNETFLPVYTGVGLSPAFHQMCRRAAEKQLSARDLVTLGYLAGRLAASLSPPDGQ